MKHVKKFIALSVLFSIALVCLSSCAEKPEETGIHELRAMHMDNLVEYGNYIYSTRGVDGMLRFDRRTNQISSACTDPECPGNCLLEAPILYFSQIVDGRLYFASWAAHTHEYTYAYLDIPTGQVVALRECGAIESTVGTAPSVADGGCYDRRKILQPVGDPKNPDDYLTYLCRMPADGGAEEVLLELYGDSDMLLFVHQGQPVLFYGTQFSLFDPATKARTVFFDLEAEGFGYLRGDMAMLDGKLYFLVQKPVDVYLVSLDIETGECAAVVDVPVINFRMTDDKIYYSPFETREFGSGTIYCSADLFCCNLDGSDPQVVYSNPSLDYTETFTVIDNKIYGWFSAPGSVSSYWGVIDMETKEVIQGERVEIG